MRYIAILGSVGWLVYIIKSLATGGLIVQYDEGITVMLLFPFLLINLIALVDIKPRDKKEKE